MFFFFIFFNNFWTFQKTPNFFFQFFGFFPLGFFFAKRGPLFSPPDKAKRFHNEKAPKKKKSKKKIWGGFFPPQKSLFFENYKKFPRKKKKMVGNFSGFPPKMGLKDPKQFGQKIFFPFVPTYENPPFFCFLFFLCFS